MGRSASGSLGDSLKGTKANEANTLTQQTAVSAQGSKQEV